jgi:cellobiose phosphorylase
MLKTRKIIENQGYYFPLFNLKGLKSSITPYFAGDLKLDHHTYALSPSTEIDLFHHAFSRNVVFHVNNEMYLLNGDTKIQQNDELIYETGLLYQRVIRKNPLFEIDTISFIPKDKTIEIHQVEVKNVSSSDLVFDIHTKIPLYGRSADNLRDHRHVTSLLNQIKIVDQGILLKPSLSFDERGHQENHVIYSVFVSSPHLKINRYIPILDTYIGGGSYQYPKGTQKTYQVGEEIHGYEAIGAIGFAPKTLKPKETITFYFSIGIHKNEEDLFNEQTSIQNAKTLHIELKAVKQFFQNYVNGLSFQFQNDEISNQLSWVMLQPMLRRYFGNSFLPHHDYGRGGRGWRDLWQDCLALIMNHDQSVVELLYNNFAGIRIDGSNATIIGDKLGEFKADRNQITRVWSDHGAWPLLTTKMYIDETGDIDFLLKNQTYFNDQFTHYTKKTKHPGPSKYLLNQNNKPYLGTILEHLLVINLVGFHNTGAHGFVKLEDADWNDGLDMANQKGETVPFTHMYASNLILLSDLIKALKTEKLIVFKEVELLLKEEVSLEHFYIETANFKGETIELNQQELIDFLKITAQKRISHLHQHAFVDQRFLSYFDNLGESIDYPNTINLTGQTMALLSQTATKDQATMIAKKTRDMLFAKHLGGYQLNTNYQKVMMQMGRAFGFAYGHKENGAVFSHMAIMYAYGLYQYDLVFQGQEAILAILNRSLEKDAHVWAGIPEYFNDQGIGKYPYLTGSASWMLKVMRDQVFGLKFDLGKLYIKPKLLKSDFIHGVASIKTYVFDKHITITYYNPKLLDYPNYTIRAVKDQGKLISFPITTIQGDLEVYLDENI